jgi:hypothetical protein
VSTTRAGTVFSPRPAIASMRPWPHTKSYRVPSASKERLETVIGLLRSYGSDAGHDSLKLDLVAGPWIDDADLRDGNGLDAPFDHAASPMATRRAMLRKKLRFSKR